MATAALERPIEIGRAVNCLWVSLAIGFVKSIIGMQQMSDQASALFVNFILITVVAFYAFITLKIARGRNWARITYLILTVIGLPMSVPTLAMEFMTLPVLGFLSVASICLQLYSLWIIFTDPGKSWFRRNRT